MDKGYQCVQQQEQTIIPKKKHGKILPLEDTSWNEKVVSNFLIISQNFGVCYPINTGGQRKITSVFSAFLWL